MNKQNDIEDQKKEILKLFDERKKPMYGIFGLLNDKQSKVYNYRSNVNNTINENHECNQIQKIKKVNSGNLIAENADENEKKDCPVALEKNSDGSKNQIVYNLLSQVQNDTKGIQKSQ